MEENFLSEDRLFISNSTNPINLTKHFQWYVAIKGITWTSASCSKVIQCKRPVLVLAVLLGQKSYYMPHSVIGIDGFGLNTTLASSDPIPTGFVAIHSQNRLNRT